jgi:hypothetical protein
MSSGTEESKVYDNSGNLVGIHHTTTYDNGGTRQVFQEAHNSWTGETRGDVKSDVTTTSDGRTYDTGGRRRD